MAGVFYIDLSAKVDHWAKASAVATSNGHSRVYLVTGSTKQKARALIRARHGAKSEQYRLLAVLVYLAVIDDLPHLAYIVIDRDYAGDQAEATIKNLLLELLRRRRPDITAGHIRFEAVRGTKADLLAKRVYDGKAKPGRVVTFEEIAVLLRG